MNMAYKTREDLMNEIESRNDEIKALKEDIKKLDRVAKYAEAADEMAAMRESFIDAGFSKTEAFTMCLEMIKSAAIMNSTGKITYNIR